MSTYQAREDAEKTLFDIALCEENARDSLSRSWIALWGMYKTRPIRQEVNGEWKARLNDGKVFEIVETIGSYLRNALFFSDSWLAVEANEPGLDEPGSAISPIVSSYFLDNMNRSNFRREMRVFLSQLLLIGYGGMLPYWDKERGLSFQCINSYDLFVDSSKRYDPSVSFSFRRIELNKAEFSMWEEEGYLEVPDELDFCSLQEHDSTRRSEFYSIRDVTQKTEDTILLYEYYCPIEKKLTRFIGDYVLYEQEDTPCPWVIAFLFETPEESYSIGTMDSCLGLVYASNFFMNNRLDSLAISLDNMWTFVDDGVTDPESIKTEPGSIINVGSHDSLRPLPPPANNFSLSYQEQLNLETKINQNTGTGAMISANAYRTGERVTASEIEAVKSAGGNRITDIYNHIEHTFILPVLYKAFSIVKDFTKSGMMVKIKSEKARVLDFFELLPEDLHHDFSITITATQSVINRDRNVSLLMEFLSTVASVPQFQELVNYPALFEDLLYQFGFDNPSKYIKQQEEEQPVPVSPAEELVQAGGQAGGDPMAQALSEQMQLGQAPEIAASLGGATEDDIAGLSPEQMQQANTFMNTPTL